MERAVNACGLTDFGEDHFLEPLHLLGEELDQLAEMHPLGRWLLRRYVGHFLINRLLITETLKKQPEILREEIAPPLIIIGLPRTGTSHLMNMMSRDHAHRTLSYWEGNDPAPPPNPRRMKWHWRRIKSAFEIHTANYLIPALQATHKLRLDGPEECILLLSNSFRSQIFSVQFNTPRYTAWLDQCDHTPAYIEHKQQLQILQSAIKRDRWLLKAPNHMIGIEGLLKVYPDAMIVQTHRDLGKAIPSICNLCLNTRAIAVSEQRPADIGRQMLDQLAPAMRRFMTVRDRAPEGQFYDVMYDDIIADPIGTIKGIYDHFDLPLSFDTSQHMRHELARNPKNKHGAHAYHMETFNLSRDIINDRFDDYLQRYDLPIAV